MSENKEMNPVERVKEIAELKSKNVTSLMSDIRGLKSKMGNALEMLNARKQIIKESEAKAESASSDSEIKVVSESASKVEKAVEKPAKTTPQVEPKAVEEKQVEIKTNINLEPAPIANNDAKESIINNAPISKVETQTSTHNSSDAQVSNSTDGTRPQYNNRPTDGTRPQYNNNRPTDGTRPQYNNNRPTDGTRPQYNNNRPTDGTRPQYNNNRPTDGTRPQYNNNGSTDGTRPQYNNNRPTDGTRPQYNNNRPTDGTRPQYNNNRPTDGTRPQYNNNRPTDGTRPQYNNNGPTDGTRPQYNNNRPTDGTRPQYNNNRPTDGTRPQYNNNRPNDGTRPAFNNNGVRNNVPRLPKGDIPLPVVKEMPKKKKTFEKDDKKAVANKRTMVRKGYVDNGFEDSDSAKYHKIRKIKKQNDFTPNTINIEIAIVTSKMIPVKVLADKFGKAAVEIVKKMFSLGQLVTVNDAIDFDTAELIGMDFGIKLEYRPEETAEDKLNAIVLDRAGEGELVKRPPVVTIMGHVDHGKTSLLDYIRKAKVANGEAGGITQHIGAYTIELNGEPITFLDTPGHEAFTSMRKRGAKVTDIAIIVVAGDDGIMPQTIESISHAKDAGLSIIIAVNKMDKAAANVDKIMQQLSQYDVVPEAWGGDTIICPVSAKTGAGVEELLESILLVAEVKELNAIKDCRATGNIIEARLDKGVGPVATCLIQNGTLYVGDYIVAGTSVGKVRALIDNSGRRIKEAGPSIAVAVQGFSEVPNAGDQLIVVKDEKLAKQVAQERANKDREDMQRKSSSKSLEDMFKNYSSEEKKSLGVIIKGDVQGSVEAVRQSLEALSESMEKDGVSIAIMHAGVGAINESDVMLADTGNAVVIGFNVRPEPKARQLSDKTGVDIKLYRVIYDAIDDITKALKGMLKPIFREEALGHAEVRNVFNITGVGTIAGCYITDGKVQRNAKFRLIRDNIVIFEGSISSMKRNKDEAKEVASGYECGIGLEKFNDLKVGDIIEAFLLKEEER